MCWFLDTGRVKEAQTNEISIHQMCWFLPKSVRKKPKSFLNFNTSNVLVSPLLVSVWDVFDYVFQYIKCVGFSK